MNVILIKPEDINTLHDRLKLTAFTTSPYGANTRSIIENHKLNESELKMLVNDVHSRFNYVLRMWLDEQGA